MNPITALILSLGFQFGCITLAVTLHSCVKKWAHYKDLELKLDCDKFNAREAKG